MKLIEHVETGEDAELVQEWMILIANRIRFLINFGMTTRDTVLIVPKIEMDVASGHVNVIQSLRRTWLILRIRSIPNTVKPEDSRNQSNVNGHKKIGVHQMNAAADIHSDFRSIQNLASANAVDLSHLTPN